MSREQFLQWLAGLLMSAPGGRISLADLGNRLREALPDVQPTDFGHGSLKHLLRDSREVGHLEEVRPLEWWFVASVPRLSQEWWRAVTDFDTARRCWFDLRDERLVTIEDEVRREEERFVELPRVGLPEQRSLALEWTDEQAEEVRGNLVEALLANQDLRPFLVAVEQAGLRQAWMIARAKHVVSRVLTWAEGHGISRHLPLASLPVSKAPRQHRRMHRSGLAPRPQMCMNEDELRSFVHHVIDQMTAEEIGRLPIPARFLLPH